MDLLRIETSPDGLLRLLVARDSDGIAIGFEGSMGARRRSLASNDPCQAPWP